MKKITENQQQLIKQIIDK